MRFQQTFKIRKVKIHVTRFAVFSVLETCLRKSSLPRKRAERNGAIKHGGKIYTVHKTARMKEVKIDNLLSSNWSGY